MKEQTQKIIETCEKAYEAARFDNERGPAIQRAQSVLAAPLTGETLLSTQEQMRLADVKTSAKGFLQGLESHGANGAMQGSLESLRRRAGL